MEIEPLLKKIDSYDYVSFDVFDTLLIRPYVKPTDLFLHLEEQESLVGFAKARMVAEKNTRSKDCPEVTLKEIYGNIGSEFEHAINIEMEYEAQVLTANPEMKKVFDYALSLGKKVIVISDMYLPSEFIGGVLKKNGFDNYDKLYVSCEHRRSKHFGDLFQTVLNDYGIGPGDLFHIGDNAVSDLKTPESLGISSFKYDKVIDSYFKSHKRERGYYGRKKCLHRSIIVSIDALDWINGRGTEFWANFGKRVGGPLVASFCSFIESKIKKEDGVLLFVARDGYAPFVFYNILFGTVDSHYIYAVRIFNLIFDITGKDYRGYETQIIDYFAERLELGGIERTKETNELLFSELESQIKPMMEEELDRYARYIDSIVGKKKNVYVVDPTTMKFSSQRLIMEATREKNVVGIYYNLLPSGYQYDNFHFHKYKRFFISLTNIDVPEFLMSSEECPVIGLDNEWRPVYKNPLEEDLKKMEVSKLVLEGEKKYAEMLLNLFGKKIPALSHTSVNSWMELFTRKRTKIEDEKLSEIKWASNPSHDVFHDLVFKPREIKTYLLEKVWNLYSSIKNRIERK